MYGITILYQKMDQALDRYAENKRCQRNVLSIAGDSSLNTCPQVTAKIVKELPPRWQNRRCVMLVLSRKRNEGIMISHPDGNIHIVVVEIRADKARIGVDAPKSVPVHRDEVFKALRRDEAMKENQK